MWLYALLGQASGLLLRFFCFALASVGQQRGRIAALSLAKQTWVVRTAALGEGDLLSFPFSRNT